MKKKLVTLSNIVMILITITAVAGALFMTSTVVSCTDSQKANWTSLGTPGTITLYACDGTVINKWKSTGKIATVSNSDGWEFKDEATGKFIRVSGTVVIEN